MIDKKIIKGLECCLPPHDPDCALCPYDSIDLRCRAKLRDDVMALLKAQESRAMTLEEINNSLTPLEKGCHDDQCIAPVQRDSVIVQKIQLFHSWFWCCGACKTVITEGDKFCRKCGKAVKWDAIT